MDMFIEFNYFPVSSGVDYNEKDKALLRRRINMMNVKINAKEVSLKKGAEGCGGLLSRRIFLLRGCYGCDPLEF